METKEQIIDECIKIVKSFISSNCDDHTPYRGACVSCGEHGNWELIKEPDELIEALDKLKAPKDSDVVEKYVCKYCGIETVYRDEQCYLAPKVVNSHKKCIRMSCANSAMPDQDYCHTHLYQADKRVGPPFA